MDTTLRAAAVRLAAANTANALRKAVAAHMRMLRTAGELPAGSRAEVSLQAVCGTDGVGIRVRIPAILPTDPSGDDRVHRIAEACARLAADLGTLAAGQQAQPPVHIRVTVAYPQGAVRTVRNHITAAAA